MENTDDNWDHVFEKTEDLIIKKAEEIIESLTEQERERLESQGVMLDLEEVFRLITIKLQEHFDSRDFTEEHIQEDLKKLTKKDIFEL